MKSAIQWLLFVSSCFFVFKKGTGITITLPDITNFITRLRAKSVLSINVRTNSAFRCDDKKGSGLNNTIKYNGMISKAQSFLLFFHRLHIYYTSLQYYISFTYAV
jgi:hypothetical protein